jgi:hypothetical protein
MKLGFMQIFPNIGKNGRQLGATEWLPALPPDAAKE